MSKGSKYVASLVFAVSFLVIANVQADVYNYSYDVFTASNAGYWQVATFYSDPNSNTALVSFNEVWLTTTDWTTAAQGNRYDWDQSTDWIAAVNNAPLDTYNANKVTNGFYGFKYSFSAQEGDTSVSGLLNLNVGADDFIAAIYANGTLIAGSTDLSATANWTQLVNTSFNVDLGIESFLDLVFVFTTQTLAIVKELTQWDCLLMVHC